MYVFIRKDLPLEQQIVQSSHAAIEAARAFLPPDLEHPHLIVLSVNNEKSFDKVIQKLNAFGIRYRAFVEPDRNNETTAIATEIVYDETRQVFKNYQCLKVVS